MQLVDYPHRRAAANALEARIFDFCRANCTQPYMHKYSYLLITKAPVSVAAALLALMCATNSLTYAKLFALCLYFVAFGTECIGLEVQSLAAKF